MSADQEGDPDAVAKVRANPLRALLHRVGMYPLQSCNGTNSSTSFRQQSHCHVVETVEACNNCACVPFGIRRRKHEHAGLGVYSIQ